MPTSLGLTSSPISPTTSLPALPTATTAPSSSTRFQTDVESFSTIPVTSPNQLPSTSSSENGLAISTIGGIIGACVGVLAVTACIAGLGFYLKRKKQPRTQKYTLESLHTNRMRRNEAVGEEPNGNNLVTLIREGDGAPRQVQAGESQRAGGRLRPLE